MEEVTQWTAPGIFHPSWTGEKMERLCVSRGGEGGEEGVQNPQGRAPQIQENKNASIFGRAFVSPDSWVYGGGPTIMNWIKCERKKARVRKGQDGG